MAYEFVVSTLENAIKENRIAHAYLFAGPRGVGKTSSARLLAKALNCQRGMSAHPCGVCSSCREIANGTSLDVIEIDGASNTSVNDVRKIKEEVLFPPQSSRYKIYIIDEVHMLSTSAFNALLKTIEEPPEYIIFIFATTEIQKVPATIKSRCQVFRFQLIPQEKIQECLKEAAGDLNIEADEDALFWIAKEATGSMRDAYTLFDQVASFSGDHITLEKIRQRLNLAGFSKISEIVSYSLLGNPGKAIEEISSLLQSGVSTEQITKDGADFFRALLFYKNGIRRSSILGVEENEIPEDIVNLLSKEQLEAGLRAFMNLYRDLRYTLSPQFELELLFSRLSSLPYLVSSDTLMRKLEDMKKGIAEGSVVIKKKSERVIEASVSSPSSSLPPETPATQQYEPVREKKEEKIEEEIEYNHELIEAIEKEIRADLKPLLSHHILNADIARDGGYLVLTVKSEIARDLLNENRKEVESAIAVTAGEPLQLRIIYNKPKDIEYSDKILSLQSIFGGKIIINRDDTAEAKKENKPKEIKQDEPVRTSRNDEEFESADGEEQDTEGED